MAPIKFVDPTQQGEGEEAQWVDEPLAERHDSLTVHTRRPFNAEPTNRALQEMLTEERHHYRRQHAPVPVVVEADYRLAVEVEGREGSSKSFSMGELRQFGAVRDIACTLMCTGNRRGELNQHGETAGLPWLNGSISTARWGGCYLADVLKEVGVTEGSLEGFHFVTFWGLEDYHVSVPLKQVLRRENDVLLAWTMNGRPLPRDHGFPLRVVVPGYVGARCVKWLARVVVMEKEVNGMHQTGIAYKQLGPNIKSLSGASKAEIAALPPVDHVPILSAITQPEPGAALPPGAPLEVKGYAYSGAGRAVIRVDVSMDGGATWAQAAITRADAEQGVRSERAWAWVQWRFHSQVPQDAVGELNMCCKAVDDQYNQQPHDTLGIWNIRGILNTAWGRVKLKVGQSDPVISGVARL